MSPGTIILLVIAVAIIGLVAYLATSQSEIPTRLRRVLKMNIDNKSDDAKNSPTPTHTGGRIPGPAPQPSDGGSGGDDGGSGGDSGGSGNLPPNDGSSAIDAADAVSLPVLDGWAGQSGIKGSSVSYGPYTCPGTSGVTFNGQPLTADDNAALAALCRDKAK